MRVASHAGIKEEVTFSYPAAAGRGLRNFTATSLRQGYGGHEERIELREKRFSPDHKNKAFRSWSLRSLCSLWLKK
jgi:hypothetical protein